MSRTRRSSRGVTLTEVLIAAAMASIFFVGLASLVSKNLTLFKRMSVRQETMQDSRVVMERMDQILRNGKARSLVISTPGTVPNSRVDFSLVRPLPSGATGYAIYLTGTDVFGQEFGPGLQRAPQVLAKNVTGLMFTGDSKDPAILSVSIRIDAPWDATRDPNRVTTMLMPNHRVRLEDAP